jgi:hypothetical protein
LFCFVNLLFCQSSVLSIFCVVNLTCACYQALTPLSLLSFFFTLPGTLVEFDDMQVTCVFNAFDLLNSHHAAGVEVGPIKLASVNHY